MVKIGNIALPDFPLLLAPMEDVSDPPFRAVCKDNGADLMYTEFISSEGLIRDAIKSRQKLDIFDYERPIGIQIFGGDEEAMAMSARIVDAVNPDLLDINFGCPVKKVVSKGAGAAVLKDTEPIKRHGRGHQRRPILKTPRAISSARVLPESRRKSLNCLLPAMSEMIPPSSFFDEPDD